MEKFNDSHMMAMDFIKKQSEADPKIAFEQYVALYHGAFKPATSPGPYGRKSSSYFHRRGLIECSERLKKRDTESLRVGADREVTDDMIEYGLRLATGTRAPYDDDKAYAIFKKMVYDSQHPPEKRAIAANLAISCLKRKAWEDGDVLSTSLGFAEISCRFGPFSWCILHLMQLHEREGWDLQHGPKKLTTLPNLWKAYDQFREETGIQKMNPTICAKCHKKPKKGEKLRKCAGLCIDEKKPLYCGRVCQKADWRSHRKWCKIEKVDSDDNWTTDSEREDWEYNEDEFDKLDIFD